jgi:hypothetical protein
LNAVRRTLFEYADGRTSKDKHSSTAHYNKIDISPMISLGLEYKINKQLRFTAEPVFSYGIIHLTDLVLKENLWQAGLIIGVYYRLG